MEQICGCYYHIASQNLFGNERYYLPQVQVQAHTIIFSTASRTTLKQTFSNPSTADNIKECLYIFPLYDGVSVVSFTCRIGSRTLRGIVKERSKAKETYDEAVARGETAGLLEQLPDSSDVFGTRLGNIPAGESVHVEITYVGELKHDAEADGIRFTLPTTIAPRYGARQDATALGRGLPVQETGGITITIDASMAKGSFIRGIQSPTHPIAVTLGNISTSRNAGPMMHQASATLSLASSELDRDFVLIVQTKDNGIPKAIMEIHPSIPNQRALMVNLVPNFSLPPTRPEIVFVVDRSGSMRDKIPALKLALKVFLKSLPVGVKFNICSFGSSYSFLWEKSRVYNRERLDEALSHVESFASNFGGTETFIAIKATVQNRFVELPCELMLLTDGQIWNHTEVFSYLNKEVGESKAGIRVFTLGIGNSISHALVEGIARAGNGFAQVVGDNEKLDKKVIRMLKGALSPHLTDCRLEVKYEINRTEVEDHETTETELEDYEMIEKVTDSLKVLLTQAERPAVDQIPISIFDADKPDQAETPPSAYNASADPYSHLPTVSTPKLLQTPSVMPPLFPFSRAAVYLLLSENTMQKNPKAIILRAKCAQSPLELEIPIELVSESRQTIHQLAARKVIQELEEGRGWIFDSRDQSGVLVKDQFPGRFDEMVEREAVRLGTQFQVSGKWLSWVAVLENDYKCFEDEREKGPENISDRTTATEAEGLCPANLKKRQNSPWGYGGGAGLDGYANTSAQFGKRVCGNYANIDTLGGSVASASKNFGAPTNLFGAPIKNFGAPLPADNTRRIQSLQSQSFSFARNADTRGSVASASNNFGASTNIFGVKQEQQQLRSFGASLPAHTQRPQQTGLVGATRLAGASLFGAPQQQQMGLFGAPQSANTQSLGQQQAAHFGGSQQASLFGGSQPADTQRYPQSLSRSAGASIFGASQQQQMGLFGASQQQQVAHFGALQQTSPFGASQQQQVAHFGALQQTSPFGASQSADTQRLQHQSFSSGPSPAEMSDSEKVHAVIEMQSFEGDWEFSEQLAIVTGLRKDSFEKQGAETVWVTVLVIAFLEHRMRQERDIWELVVEKARLWLQERCLDSNAMEEEGRKVVMGG